MAFLTVPATDLVLHHRTDTDHDREHRDDSLVS